VRATIGIVGPVSFRASALPALLRWVVVALVLASAPVVSSLRLGSTLVPLALLLATEELDGEARHGAATVCAFFASLQGAPFAVAALAGGALRLARSRSLGATMHMLASAIALAVRALPLAERLHPLAHLDRLPTVVLTPPQHVDTVVVALGCAGLVVAILRRAMPEPRPASEIATIAIVLPLACIDRESWIGLDAATARTAVVVALARPMAAAAAASFTLAGRDRLARYRGLFLGVAWLAFVARAGTDLAYRAREAPPGADASRGIVAGLPEHAAVLVDDDALFARLLVARALGVIPESTAILRWANESPARLAAELSRDGSLRPMVRDLTLRGQGDPRTLFDLAKGRPVRSTAGSVWTPDTASRLVPAGFFLRPLDEEREPASLARTPAVDDRALAETLAALHEGSDRASTVEAHRLLCTQAGLFASSSRRELAGRYCRLMAPASDVVRCSVCPNELRLSARDR
jgi:hypothetical protein